MRIQSPYALAPSIAEPLGRDSSQECISSGAMLSAIKEKSERLDNIAPDVEPLLASQQEFFELLFSQLGSDDRTVSQCSQDAEHQACSPMPAIDRGWLIRNDLSRASLAIKKKGHAQL